MIGPLLLSVALATSTVPGIDVGSCSLQMKGRSITVSAPVTNTGYREAWVRVRFTVGNSVGYSDVTAEKGAKAVATTTLPKPRPMKRPACTASLYIYYANA